MSSGSPLSRLLTERGSNTERIPAASNGAADSTVMLGRRFSSGIGTVAVSTISIGYDADLRAVEAVIADALPAMYEENRGIFLDVPQYIGVEELAESGVVLKFIVSATEENIFAARRALNRSLKLLFDEKGIDIPYPQLTVHTK